MKTLPILLLLALVCFGNFTIKANTNFFNDLKLLPIAFDAPPDTIKPSVSLLGFDSVISPLKADYIDPPIALIDNVDSDSALRPLLIVVSTLTFIPVLPGTLYMMIGRGVISFRAL